MRSFRSVHSGRDPVPDARDEGLIDNCFVLEGGKAITRWNEDLLDDALEMVRQRLS